MDDLFSEKTVAADPFEDRMPNGYPSEGSNPYENNKTEGAEQPKPQYQPPQPQQYRQPPQYPPQQFQPQQYPPQQYPPQQYPPQQYPPQYRPQPNEYYRPVQPQYHQFYRQPVPGGGAAKAFAIVAFVAGCISLTILVFMLLGTSASSTAYKYRSDRGALAAIALTYSFICSIPGLTFGIVALSKKTNKFPLALLGTIFCGALILYGLIMLMSIA